MNKQEFFDIVFPHPKLEELMWNIDNNKLLETRSILQEIIDNTKPPYDFIVDDGEMKIYNARIRQLNNLELLYKDLMKELEKKEIEQIRTH